MPGPYVYAKVDDLENTDKVSTHSCVTLLQYYTPNVGKASTWDEGIKVRNNAIQISKGTAIATFVGGKYPNKSSGNHAAYYISQDAKGITIMDQWTGDSKPKVSSRHIKFKGAKKDGTYVDPSNNADAFSVIL